MSRGGVPARLTPRARLTPIVLTLLTLVLIGGVPAHAAGAGSTLAVTSAGSPRDGIPHRGLSPTDPRSPGDLVLTAVTPPTATPTAGVTITGSVRSASGATFADPTIRVVRARSGLSTQEALDAWLDAGDSSAGTEVARTQLRATVSPPVVVPFSLTIPPDALRLTRSYGVLPLAIELISADGERRGLIRTFVGWQRAPEFTPIDLAVVVPITLDADPTLHSQDPAARAAAWTAATGPSSRLARLVAGARGSTIPIAYAVDPAVLGPVRVAGSDGTSAGKSTSLGSATDSSTSTPGAPPTPAPAATPAATSAATPAGATGVMPAPTPGPSAPPSTTVGPPTAAESESNVRAGFVAALKPISAKSTIWALPEADLDLAALGPGDAGSTVVQEALLPATRLDTALASDLTTRTIPRLAWPIDGLFPEGFDARLRAAYRTGPDLLLLSSAATRTGELTPSAPARTAEGTPVARWDDRLSEIAASAGEPTLTGETIQRFVAQSMVLLSERPSIRRQAVVTLPRGIDVDPESLTRFLQALASTSWLTPVGLDAVASQAVTGEIAIAETPAQDLTSRAANSALLGPTGVAIWPSVPPSMLATGVLPALTERQAVLLSFREAQAISPTTIAPIDRWLDTTIALGSVRWRDNPGGHRNLTTEVDHEVGDLAASLTIVPQTTNFLADEGVLLVTVSNDLDVPVVGVTVHLAPTNGRMSVSEQAPSVSVAAKSKASVPVRMIAVAQGLVPIEAWLTGPTGTRLGNSTMIEVRAAPPGAWLYVVSAAVLAGMLIVGVWRAARRPSRVPDSVVLDPVLPTPEPPYVEPAVEPGRAANPPDGTHSG